MKKEILPVIIEIMAAADFVYYEDKRTFYQFQSEDGAMISLPENPSVLDTMQRITAFYKEVGFTQGQLSVRHQIKAALDIK